MRDLIINLLCVKSEQVFANVSSDLGNIDARVPPHYRLPVQPNQELFKVPLDVADLKRLPEQSVGGVIEVVSNRRAGVLHEQKQPKTGYMRGTHCVLCTVHSQVNSLHLTDVYGHKKQFLFAFIYIPILLSGLVIYMKVKLST